MFHRLDLPCNTHQLEVKHPQHHDLLEASPVKMRRKKSDCDQENSCGGNENKRKRIIHRDIERQRRQEMAALYRALRLQLPLEYLKGNRSLSDHMNEAVNYIKHLKSKIEVLNEKRERIQKLWSKTPVEHQGTECFSNDTVTVKSSLSGVQVVMKTGCSLSRPGRVQQLTLSGVLKVLVANGLAVLGCVSTRVNHMMLHSIESEVFDNGKEVDISELQQKLTNVNVVKQGLI